MIQGRIQLICWMLSHTHTDIGCIFVGLHILCDMQICQFKIWSWDSERQYYLSHRSWSYHWKYRNEKYTVNPYNFAWSVFLSLASIFLKAATWILKYAIAFDPDCWFDNKWWLLLFLGNSCILQWFRHFIRKNVVFHKMSLTEWLHRVL